MNILSKVADTLSSNPVLAAIKDCTGSVGPLLTGECDLVLNTTGGWHRDLTDDMGLDTRIFEDGDFTVYKLAIYLQDQDATSNAVFKVRPGSHRRADGVRAPVEPVPVRAGDVVVFDVRLDHAGQLPTSAERLMRVVLRRFGSLSHADPEKWFTNARSVIAAVRMRKVDRMAIFMTFGPAAPCTYAYEKAGRHRHGPLPGPLDSGARSRFSLHGVEIIPQ